MEIKSTFYPLTTLLFFSFLILQFCLGFKMPLLIFLNLILLFLIIVNFNAPFFFVFILALIGGIVLDIFYLNLWGINFGLFLLLIFLQKIFLKFFEKKSIFTLIVIGELLIFIYFSSILLFFWLAKQPLYYLNLTLSLLLNLLIYWFFIKAFYQKLIKNF